MSDISDPLRPDVDDPEDDPQPVVPLQTIPLEVSEADAIEQSLEVPVDDDGPDDQRS
jgi:hypothetical protein